MRRSMPVDYVDDCHFRKIASDRAANVKPLWVGVRVARWHIKRCERTARVRVFSFWCWRSRIELNRVLINSLQLHAHLRKSMGVTDDVPG
jgi:hypothetical protein